MFQDMGNTSFLNVVAVGPVGNVEKPRAFIGFSKRAWKSRFWISTLASFSIGRSGAQFIVHEDRLA